MEIVEQPRSLLRRSRDPPRTVRASQFGCDFRMDAMLSDTRASVRPLTITRVPSAASDLTIAEPIPAVEPVTKAVLFSSFKFMDVCSCVFLICYELMDG